MCAPDDKYDQAVVRRKTYVVTVNISFKGKQNQKQCKIIKAMMCKIWNVLKIFFILVTDKVYYWIIGGAAGAIALLMIIIALVILLIRHRTQRPDTNNVPPEPSAQSNSSGVSFKNCLL